ncbi:TPA: fimbrial biogenesis outer membrane usher protein [Escherichia coli]|nr:fimbrial biogenesis outer membrane usher protein [Escherichia coli]HAW7687699.1 fimbrial biogenesis outer membrane usher protein [Escherichia coli]
MKRLIICFFFTVSGNSLAKKSLDNQNSPLLYNSDFLVLSDGEKASSIDLAYFSHSGGALPGVYNVSVYINGEQVANTQEVEFINKNGKLSAVIQLEALSRWGVDTLKLNNDTTQQKKNITDYIYDADESLDLKKAKLSFSIPQKYVKEHGVMNTPYELWDGGIVALLSSYYYSGFHDSKTTTSSSDFLSVDNSLNINKWRLRHVGSWRGNSSEKKWDTSKLYLQHDYPFGQGGVFTLGRNNIENGIISPFPFEGAQIYSDNEMLKPEMRSFGPVVRGIANSDAVVTISQFGSVIYQRNVPPGPFELSDFSSAVSGNLDIEIAESDGTIRRYSQTSATLPVLQKKGISSYNIAAGYHYSYVSDERGPSPFYLLSGGKGVSDTVTLYGASILSQDYRSFLFGVGTLIDRIGAISLDASIARSAFDNNDDISNGRMFRLKYSNHLPLLDMGFDFSVNRYSTEGFFDYGDFQSIKHANESRYDRGKTEITSTIQKNFGDYGQFSLSGSRIDYWSKTNSYILSANYSIPFRYMSTAVSFNSSSYKYGDSDKSIFLSVNVPLNIFSNKSKGMLSYNSNISSDRVMNQVGYNGMSEDNRLSYSLRSAISNDDDNYNSANISYRSSVSRVNIGYTRRHETNRFTYSVNGGVALHSNGVTLTQPLNLNNANALVKTNGISGIGVKNKTGLYTDYFGYAVVPNLIPYQRNNISLDVNSTRSDVELLQTDISVIPNRGALVSVPFDVNSGHKVLFTLTKKNGVAVPFGSIVTLKNGHKMKTGIVSDNGQVYMSGLSLSDTLIARWGDGNNDTCMVDYELQSRKSKYHEVQLVCN